jgi:DNA-binding transcriptional regulator YiaG
MTVFSASELCDTPEGPVQAFEMAVASEKIDWQGILCLPSHARNSAVVLVWCWPANDNKFSWPFSNRREQGCAALCKHLGISDFEVIDLETLTSRRSGTFHLETTRVCNGALHMGFLQRFPTWDSLALKVGVPGVELCLLMQALIDARGGVFNVTSAVERLMVPSLELAPAPSLDAAAVQHLRRFNAQMTVEHFARWLQVPVEVVQGWESAANAKGAAGPTGVAARLLQVLGAWPRVSAARG